MKVEHNCLEKIRTEFLSTGIFKDHKDKYVKFEKELTSYNGDKTIKTTGQGILAGFYFNTKNGLRREKKIKTFIPHRFCPFCGISYDKLFEE